MNKHSRRSFVELFLDNDFGNVVIPIIQRDYAQGRVSAKEIREQFLESLLNALMLPEDSPKLPLDLDFVYGNIDVGSKSFYPLDGQQRLTTLFLLHWYLSCKDGKNEQFQSIFRSGNKSKFTYKVRPSSTEFFDQLVGLTLDLSKLMPSDESKCNQLSKTIENYPWFFLSWKRDPTILSVLEMLDTIHEKFEKYQNLYEKIIQIEKPYVTFQFLNLKDYDLSDDLYIKMNARGKPLTSFESFKAGLEQLIEDILPGEKRDLNGREVTLREYFSFKVDTQWSDLFWHFKQKEETNKLFDREFMNFIRSVAVVSYSRDLKESNREDSNHVIDSLIDYEKEFKFNNYKKNNCFSGNFIKILVQLLDTLSSSSLDISTFLTDDNYYDEKSTFINIIRGGQRSVIQSNWIQYIAYCNFIVNNCENLDKDELYEWMRVISNLANNTVYPHSEDLVRTMKSVHTVYDNLHSASVLHFISDESNDLGAFNQKQILEERLKAQLILRSDKWRNIIIAAEKHGYFKGQIEFLLKYAGIIDRWNALNHSCAWDDVEDQLLRENLSSYYEKSCALFDENGLKFFKNHLVERALLSIGNYLLTKSANFSFLENSDRDASWKRLLRGSDQVGKQAKADEKRQYLKILLDRIDGAKVNESLQSIIDDYLKIGTISNDELWRRKFIECEEAIRYCGERQIRMQSPDDIYLLSKKQMNGNHAELFSFHLKYQVLDSMYSLGQLKPFDSIEYASQANDYYQPQIHLYSTGKKIWLLIQYSAGQYIYEFQPVGNLPSQYLDYLRNHASYLSEKDDFIRMKSNEGTVVGVLIELLIEIQKY